MRLLVTGGGGQLSGELTRTLARHDVIFPSRDQLDVTSETAVRSLVSDFRPDFIIHTAALTDTTLCERDPLQAQQVNAIGALNVASAAARTGAIVVHISTNEVFDGQKTSPYVESDEPHPVNAYGYSKLCGERAVMETCERFYIVRTAWLYGEGARNFPAKIVRAALATPDLRVVDDEISTPTWCADLAVALTRLLEERPPFGVYHLANAGQASRFEWASYVLDKAGVGARVTPISSREFRNGSDSPRKPLYTVLANTLAAGAGILLRDWREALDEYFAKLTPGALGTAPA